MTVQEIKELIRNMKNATTSKEFIESQQKLYKVLEE